ncbi:MAG: leucine-rich repeat protein [Spirochaetaceae bacterium]|nr:leucine-rich repeat protein [Spirochaetaceae bacterium]
MNEMKSSICLCVLLFCAAVGVWSQQKYALIIGNGRYANFGALKNPVNDADDMEAVLKNLDWNVEKIINGSLEQMEEAVFRLRNRLNAAQNAYGFFFYAGHGVQSNGENYLIPADANISSENLLRQRAMSVTFALEELNSAGNALNVLVLDACRSFPASWARNGTEGLGAVRNQPAESIVVYATGASSTASDGEGRNGLFTEYLLNHLKTPGIEVAELFRRTGGDVARASGNKQRPAVYNQFFGLAYLGTSAPQPVPPGLEWELAEDSSVRITGYTGNAPWLVIPERIQGFPVASIGWAAFRGCATLISVSIPPSVKFIGDYAFSWCNSLTAIRIPPSVASIGKAAFFYCASLTAVTIPNSVSSIENVTFSGCASLTEITIPSSVARIGLYAFIDCPNLTSITVDKDNPNYASSNGVLFDKRIQKLIQYPAGKRGAYLIPPSVEEIAAYAFAYCSGLSAVTIPNSVKSIMYSAFSHCDSLTAVTIPGSVKEIGGYTFAGCGSLTSITVDKDNPNYASSNGILFDKRIQKLIQYPAGKRGAYLIPSSVTSIEDAAFSGCGNLTSVIIPESVRSIREGAFAYCYNLKTVSLSRRTTVEPRAFPEGLRITYSD